MVMGAKPAASWQDDHAADATDSEATRLPDSPAAGTEDTDIATEALATAGAAEPDESELPEIESPLREKLPALVVGAAAFAWVALSFWAALEQFTAQPLSAAALMQWVAMTAAPLALAGVFYLLLGRTSRREARRFVTAARAMRMEAAHLESALAMMSARIEANRASLGEQAHQLLLLGDDTANRLAEISGAMARESAALAEETRKLETASGEARIDMGVLLADLPRAEGQTRGLAELIKSTGLEAHQQAVALEAQLAAVTSKGREADELLGGAAQRLAAHLSRIESAAEAASTRLGATAQEANMAADAVLAQAAETLDEARRGITAQNAALLAMVEEARAALSGAGDEAAAQLVSRLDAISAQLGSFGATLAEQDEGTSALLAHSEQRLAALSRQLEAFAEQGQRRLNEVNAAAAATGEQTMALRGGLDDAVARADALRRQAEVLGALLEQSTAQLGDALPGSLARLEEQAARSREAVSAASIDAVKLVTSATATTARLTEAEALIERQKGTLDALAAQATEQLRALEAQADALGETVDRTGAGVRQLADSAGPQLIDALVRVREAASQAAQKAREAIAQVIPDAVAALSDAAGPAAAEALTQRVEAQLAEVSLASERAVQAAHQATERLMRQMLTIADTTASVESRIAEAKAELEEKDEDASARRVALLIESLNSIAIDVTKILSNDVTDSAWAAYLKGDRGIFTRRAVRLLDTSEAREIVRHYEDEPEFREQVNRYVHDFEAMLRRVLAARDGSPLGITLLSSDMGKLYVALAQAIERLRT